MDEALGEGRGGGADTEFPLFAVIDRIRQSEHVIAAEVEERRLRIGREMGLTDLALAEAVGRDLVEDAAVRSALIGAGAALPITLPLVGPWVSLGLSLFGGALFQLATEVELVYAVAAAYRTRLRPDRLRVVAFWLVRLSNYEDLQKKAFAMGVRVTVRKLVQKLIAVGIARAVGATATGMMTGMMGRAAANAPAPWYIRATGLLGVPVLACFGWQSTQGVGERAIAYFAEERSHPEA